MEKKQENTLEGAPDRTKEKNEHKWNIPTIQFYLSAHFQ